jgi:N6-adenosine-specific RNA methylase IME4
LGLEGLLAAGRKYQVIYCDPPWLFKTWSEKGRGRSPKYNEMTAQDLRLLPVWQLADERCALAMWVIWTHLQQAILLMGAWGFDYSTCLFNWHKVTNGKSRIAKGYTTRSSTEVCLLGKRHRGRLPAVRARGIDQFWEAPVGEHSAKPLIFYHLLERLFGEVPRVELFARKIRHGWDAMGNELPLDKMPDAEEGDF